MRIWSIHPKYLDSKGLVALWRETLLAKQVLEGKTRGYKNHPQLVRFKNADNGVNLINNYLKIVYDEAEQRAFKFDKSKFKYVKKSEPIPVTIGQLQYEFDHLLKKLSSRSPGHFDKIKDTSIIEFHPVFRIIPGEVEHWEVI